MMDFTDPRALALLNFGANMMQSGGSSPREITFGEALGHGMQGGIQGLITGNQLQQMKRKSDMEEKQHALSNLMLEMQMKEATRKHEMQQNIMGRLGFGGQQQTGMQNASMQAGMSQQSTGGQFPFNLNDVTAMKMAGLADMLPELQYAQKGAERKSGSYYINPITNQREYMPKIPDGSTITSNGGVMPMPGSIESIAALEGAKTGATERAKAGYDFVDVYDPKSGSMVKVNRQQMAEQPYMGNGFANGGGGGFMQAAPRQQDITYNNEMAKSEAGRVDSIHNTAMQAPQMISKYQRIGSLLQDFNGGTLSPTMKSIASAANSLGIKIDPKLGNKEAAEALSIEIANGMRQPGTGVMTDKDFENFMNTTPSLAKSAEGRKMIIDTAIKKYERDMKLSNIARKWTSSLGRLDSPDVNGRTFYDYLDDFAKQNPVVPQQ